MKRTKTKTRLTYEGRVAIFSSLIPSSVIGMVLLGLISLLNHINYIEALERETVYSWEHWSLFSAVGLIIAGLIIGLVTGAIIYVIRALVCKSFFTREKIQTS